MRTKEIRAKLLLYGLTALVDENTKSLVVAGTNLENLVEVSENKRGIVSFKKPVENKDVVEAIMDYANTPLDYRHELKSKKYYVRIKGLDKEDGYLNFNHDSGDYFVDGNDSIEPYTVKFTKPEVESLVDAPDFFLQTGSYELELAD